jgi:predicted dehydrogenase
MHRLVGPIDSLHHNEVRHMTPRQTSFLNRRRFVQGAVLASVALTRSAKAHAGGANARLGIGVIGCGSQAGHHVKALLAMSERQNVGIAVVCDVFDKRTERFAAQTGAEGVKDYRRVLDRKDVDYVLIATPEHWHARQVLDALDAGKHVYCEKPMTHTIDEAKAVLAKVKSTGLKLQLGVQGMSDDSYEVARDMIKQGALGKVVQAQIDYSRNYKGDDFWVRPVDPDAKPGVNLDWEAWLGPAPKRPFDPDRFFSWRRYWDYSGGVATDLLVHRITRLIKATDLSVPTLAVGTGGKHVFRDSKAEIPDTFNMLLEYPEGVSVLAISSMANSTPIPHVIRGHEATLEFRKDGFVIHPQKEFAGERPEFVHHRTGGEDVGLHHENLQAAIRTGSDLKCDVVLGYQSVVATVLAIESYRTGKVMTWPTEAEG